MNRPASPRHGSLNARCLAAARSVPPVALLLTLAGTLGACATDPRQTSSPAATTPQAAIIVDRPADSTIPRAIWVLREAAPRSSPQTAARTQPPPPGIDATRIAAPSASDPNASRPLDELVTDLATSFTLSAPTDA